MIVSVANGVPPAGHEGDHPDVVGTSTLVIHRSFDWTRTDSNVDSDTCPIRCPGEQERSE